MTAYDCEESFFILNSLILSWVGGKPRSAVRNLISSDEGGVRLASHACTKTGDNIVTVLQAKHAPLRELNVKSL